MFSDRAEQSFTHILNSLCRLINPNMAIQNEMKQQQQQIKEEFIFKSKLPDIHIPKHLPLHSYCFQNLPEFGSRPCLINAPTGEIFTYSDVELAARRVASGLKKLGIQHGDVIMVLLPNCPEFVFSFLGASFCGAITTAANPFFTAAEIAKQAKASHGKVIVTQACYYEKVKDLGVTNLVFVDSPPEGHMHFSELMADDDDVITGDEIKIHPDDVVALPYSSGTTGLPKGIIRIYHVWFIFDLGHVSIDWFMHNLFRFILFYINTYQRVSQSSQ